MSEERRLTRPYSERLGILRGEQLQAALDRFGLGVLQDAEPAPGGLFGQNVFLRSTRGEYVLRGSPHSDWQLPKERLTARLIHEHTRIAAPWPYLLETSPALFGWSYALMPRLPGVIPPVGRPESGSACAAALGEGLARLHALRDEGAGAYDLANDAFLPWPTPHGQRVVDGLHQWLGWCREAREGCIRDADEAWIASVVAGARGALDEPFEACFVHHDWKPNNALAEQVGGTWRVTGVVDLMEGYFGDGEEDLVRTIGQLAQLGRTHVARFTEAYGAARPLRPGFAERYRIYQLVDRLVYWQYGQKHRVWFSEDQELRTFAEPLVEGLRPF